MDLLLPLEGAGDTRIATITSDEDMHARLSTGFRAGPVTFSFEPEEDDFDALLTPDAGSTLDEPPRAVAMQIQAADGTTYEFFIHENAVMTVLLPAVQYFAALQMRAHGIAAHNIDEVISDGINYQFHVHTTRHAMATATPTIPALDKIREALAELIDRFLDDEDGDEEGGE